MPIGIPKYKELIKNFEDAVEHKCMKGSYPPEEWDWVEGYYTETKKQLMDYIKKLKGK